MELTRPVTVVPMGEPDQGAVVNSPLALDDPYARVATTGDSKEASSIDLAGDGMRQTTRRSAA